MPIKFSAPSKNTPNIIASIREARKRRRDGWDSFPVDDDDLLGGRETDELFPQDEVRTRVGKSKGFGGGGGGRVGVAKKNETK